MKKQTNATDETLVALYAQGISITRYVMKNWRKIYFRKLSQKLLSLFSKGVTMKMANFLLG